jgi:predicted transcriptional regulator/transcriptional regulator with XRE-family HTH domain
MPAAATAQDRKLFLGARLRRLRRELGLTQTRMAQELAVSPSYLNHLERNQRPLTAQILLRLAQTYDIDVRSLSSEVDAGGAQDLAEVLADPLFRDLAVPRHEIGEALETTPGLAEAFVRLYRAHGERRLYDGASRGARSADPAASITPSDWVSDHFQGQRNHFPELEDLGETLAGELRAEPHGFFDAARQRLAESHGVQVRIASADLVSDLVRRYDHHRRRLIISERLDAAGRAFALAYQLGLFEGDELLSALVARAAPPDIATARLLKVTLANYLAAAQMMPYAPFRSLCEETGYDMDRVRARFGVGFEQACHRLTSLSRPTARGVPFFMLRVDAAGNTSKRFAAGAFPFSRFGGVCPRWRLHAAFRTPGRIVTQIIETPEGQRYFTFARTVRRVAPPPGEDEAELSLGLGCELKYAHRLAYARGLDLGAPQVTQIGPSCRICERPACPQRAAEPAGRALAVDSFEKTVSPYPFSAG